MKDTFGEAVIGANVTEVGTSNGTITDIDGNFSLNVSSKGQLRVSFIGYQSQTLDIAGQKTLNITLKENWKYYVTEEKNKERKRFISVVTIFLLVMTMQF